MQQAPEVVFHVLGIDSLIQNAFPFPFHETATQQQLPTPTNQTSEKNCRIVRKDNVEL